MDILKEDMRISLTKKDSSTVEINLPEYHKKLEVLQLQINELDVPSNAPTLLNKVNEISELFNTTNILNESNVIVSNELDELDDDDQDLIADIDGKPNGLEKPVIKKRGRKPKGGKIIQQVVSIDNQKIERPNVIMHLKCSMKDLQSSTNSSCLIESFNFNAKNDLSYEILNSSNAFKTPR